MGVKERLSAYLSYRAITKSEFGRTIGVSSAYVSSIRRSIDKEKLKSIALNYPDLNIDWLLYGEGEMLKSNPGNPGIKGDEERIPLFDCDYRTSFLDIMNGIVYPSSYICIPGLKADGAVRNHVSPFNRRSVYSPDGVILVFDKIDIESIESSRYYNLYLLTYYKDLQQDGSERIPLTITTRIKLSNDHKAIQLYPPGFSKGMTQEEISIDRILAIGLIKASITLHVIE